MSNNLQNQPSSKNKNCISFAAATFSEMEEWVVEIQTSIFNIYSSSNIHNSPLSDSLQRPYDRGKFCIYLLLNYITLLQSTIRTVIIVTNFAKMFKTTKANTQSLIFQMILNIMSVVHIRIGTYWRKQKNASQSVQIKPICVSNHVKIFTVDKDMENLRMII